MDVDAPGGIYMQCQTCHSEHFIQFPKGNHVCAGYDFRPSVIIRNISSGSQSDTGVHTRGALMSILHSLKKQDRNPPVVILKQLAIDISQDPYPASVSRRIRLFLSLRKLDHYVLMQ